MKPLALALCFLCFFASLALAANDRNDDMYPPSDQAKPFIDFDGKGFIVHGRHTYIESGSIHYARVPAGLWADRLLRMKQANFNTVQTYAFWNFNEPAKGHFDFAGDKDIGAFLATAQKIGLYATVRPGPYVCAEWDSGGYPVWLKFEPGLASIRDNSPAWLALNDHWYDKILPIVAQHQINHGGNVIIVQLENEHPHGWGVLPDNPYFVHLHDVAVKDGIEVPHFMSGMHHGGNPSPGNLDTAKRTTPWYSTESWPGWFDDYRLLSNKKFHQIIDAQWAIAAHGGDGQNFYMLHGGSNFASWNDDSTGASYDYGAAIGQAGDLRPIYYQMKRANQLTQSFPDILGNSTDASSKYKDFVGGNHDVQLNGARQSDAGTIVFLQNKSRTEATAQLKSGDSISLAPYANYAFPQDAVIADGVKITDTSLPVLGVAHNDQVVTVIVYGLPGATGHLILDGTGKTDGPITNVSIDDNEAAASKNKIELPPGFHVNLKIHVPPSAVSESTIYQGDKEIRILAVNEDTSLYTWILGAPDKQNVIVGPAYVSALEKTSDGKMAVTFERPYGQASCGQVAVYGAKGESWHLAAKADTSMETQPAPVLGGWQEIRSPQVAVDYDDSKWMQSDAPQQMGADGDYSAFAWYRATVDVPTAGPGTLQLKTKDNVQVFVNGVQAPNKGDTAQADFVAGKNTIAVLVSHTGRQKAFAYLHGLSGYDEKGLTKTPTLSLGGKSMDVKGWKLHGGVEDPAALTGWTALTGTAGVPTYYQAHFTAKPPGGVGAYPILRANYHGLARGMIWVNGHSLGRYPEKIRIDSLYIPECWLSADGQNTITYFDETGASPASAGLEIEFPASREIAVASEPIDPATPIVVPVENPVIDYVTMNKDNLAFKCPATATCTGKAPGSQPSEPRPASEVTDGDPETAWSAPDPKNQASAAITVDLGKPQPIKVCELFFDGRANGYRYALEGSTDNQTWTKLADQTTAVPTSPDSPSELARLNLPGDPWQYLRVTIHDGNNFSIHEIRAYADKK